MAAANEMPKANYNTVCPSCKGLIVNAQPDANNLIRCNTCQRAFVVRSRQSASGRMLPEAAAILSPVESLTEDCAVTRSYSPAEVIAVAYDRPDRVPLGRAPSKPGCRLFKATAWAVLGLAVSAAVGWLAVLWYRGVPGPAACAACQLMANILACLSAILAALLLILASDYAVRFEARAAWLAWRTASATDVPDGPPGGGIAYVLPALVSGLLLIFSGVLLLALHIADPALAAVGAWLIAGGLGMALLGAGAGQLRRLLWRIGHCGKLLPMRKRGDEVGLPPPLRVQPLERRSSGGLLLLALFFLMAGFGIFVWHIHVPAQGALEIALAAGGLLGLLCGAYALYRLAALWSELVQGWETAARTAGKPRLPCAGEGSARAFLAAAWTWSACVLALVLPMVRLVGNTAWPINLLSVFLPVASSLFFLWLGAMKLESYRLALAATVLSWPRILEARRRVMTRVAALALLLAATAAGLLVLGALFLKLAQLWETSSAAVASTAAPRLMLTGAVEAGLLVLPAVWLALTLLDLDRATGCLEACVEIYEPQLISKK